MPRSSRLGLRGIVVTDHKAASMAGGAILKRGGNAVDAAVASAAALSVMDPYMSGFTGFGYALYYSAGEDRVYCFDFIGEAPAAASRDLYVKEQPWEDYKPSAEGILAALVPGVVSGWATLLESFGSMRWGNVLSPAQELARGFKVTPHLHRFYESIKDRAMMNPITAKTFYKKESYPRPGAVLAQPELARTLRILAENGPQDFYVGCIGKRLVRSIQDAGGIISEDDLARYKTRQVRPIEGHYRRYTVFSLPPGSSGMTIMQWLNIMEDYDPSGMKWSSDDFLHLFLEAGKLALRDDDAFNTGKDYINIPVPKLTSKEYAGDQRGRIDSERAAFYELVSPRHDYPPGTTHLCACDKQGNIVALTQTQMYGFDRVGLIGDLGVNLNGGMCYFNMDPKHPERLEPRQRPRYVMSPTIALKDDTAVTVGAAGGWTIPQTITQTLMKIIDFGMNPQEAVAAPRCVMRYRTNSIPYAAGTIVELEHGIPRKTEEGLTRRGHAVISLSEELSSAGRIHLNFGSVNALSRVEGKTSGGAESRRDGFVAVA